MPFALTVLDETAAGEEYNSLPLTFPTEEITVRELIRERVYQEVQDFNREQAATAFCGLVQPTDTERVLNGKRTEYHFKSKRAVDWKEQYDQALKAFANNGFLILVDDHQAADLDEVVAIAAGSRVSFVKLTLLVGG